jgi:hypothetical protein
VTAYPKLPGHRGWKSDRVRGSPIASPHAPPAIGGPPSPRRANGTFPEALYQSCRPGVGFPDGDGAAYNRRMAARRFNESIEPMTLGNMRANGVRSLDVSCWQCHHRAIMNADRWPDEVPVPTFGAADGLQAVRDHRRRRASAVRVGSIVCAWFAVRRGQCAMHCARRAATPGGSGDKSRNASGSV